MRLEDQRGRRSGSTRRALLLGAAGAVVAGCVGRERAPVASASPSPEAAGPRVLGPDDGPGVLVVHAWWGVTPGILDWASALADGGARVVVPDLYGGQVATSIDEAQSLADGLDDGSVAAVLDEAVEELGGREFDAVGWSLGAFQTCGLMERVETAPRRAVLFYGGAPLSGATTTQAVQLHVVPDDPYFTDTEVTATIDGLQEEGVRVERIDHPGLRHWFAEPGSPAYDARAAAVARRRTLDFFGLA